MLLLLLCLTTVVQANLQAYHAAFGDFQVELNDKVSLSSDTQNSYTISEDVKEGEILASIQTSALLTIGYLEKYPALSKILNSDALKSRITSTTKMAVLLMYENAQSKSPWKPMLDNFAQASASTMFWPETDLIELQGTTVYEKTLERLRAIKSTHVMLEPLLTSSSEDEKPIFEEFKIIDFLYWIHQMFSKSFPASSPTTGVSNPVIAPFFESLQHDNSPSCSLEVRMINDENNLLVLVATKDLKANHVLSLRKGPSTNTYLLLDAGTFILDSSEHAIPFSLSISPTDPSYLMKKKALDMMNITDGMEFNLLANNNGAPPPLLLRMLRVQVLSFKEFDSWRKIMNSDNPVSLSNELRVLRTLFTVTSNMLSQFKNSTLDSEIEILTEFQTNRELTETQKPMTRSEVAAHLRLSEKRILMQFRNFIKNQWLSFIDMKYENLSQIDDF